MFGFILKKEFRAFFGNKGTLVVMTALPLLLLLIFGYALGNYIGANYETFDNSSVFYYVETNNQEMVDKFFIIAEEIQGATGVSFVEIDNPTTGEEDVEKSQAFGLITIQDATYSYFRSTFNEPEGGELVRNLFVQLANQEELAKIVIEKEVLEMPQIDSISYYTFSSLGFSILFMGLIVGFSVQNEKNLGTIERMQLSKAGISTIFLAKLLAGITCGLGQTLVVFIFSNVVLKVSWGIYTPLLFVLFLLLSLYSAVFGGVMGFICKSKASCQNNVMMISMLSGYFGGSITPMYLLENTAVMNIIINCSPLYWLNSATISLQNNILDKSMRNACFALVGLVVGLLALLVIHFQKNTTRKVEVTV